ncbi:MAG: mycothione reductase [Ilumatobacteraceae bacterium]|nr:mycothione reductase [Ilumatobacter sp.]MCO5329264.1 mycothione reductase [Ilumatobacteraceae bacterium]
MTQQDDGPIRGPHKVPGTTHDYDLVIIGAGSGNSIIGPEMDGWKIALVERSQFGGTCLNRGCIPTKMLVYPADLAESAKHGERFGIHTEFHSADWPVIVQRVFGRIDPIVEGGRQYRHSLPNVDVYEGTAHFVGDRTLEVLGSRIRGRQVVIAAGARAFVPDVPGIDDVPFHTSDSILRIAKQPSHLIILGGGFIATELGHVFQALGSRVTIVNRSHRLLQAEDHDISQRFTDLARRRFDLALGAKVQRAYMTTRGVGLQVALDDEERTIEGDVLLVAAGRIPNSDHLQVEAGGVAVDERGNVVVDEYGRTSAEGVWALGDINGRHQLKHMANGEAKVVRHNLAHPEALQRYDERPAPHAVFSNPQIGSVGLTEHQVQATGRPYCSIVHAYGDAAYGWAMEDTTSFCKLIGDPQTRQVIGAHLIGHEASILVQLLVQGIHLGHTADEMAHGQVWIHPALSEVVEQALLKLMDAFDAFAG